MLAVEAIGSLSMWAPIPLAWVWVAARVYEATGSLLAAGITALLGLLGTTLLAMAALTRVDTVWVRLRRRAGYEQKEGALNQIVVVSATLGLLAFTVWYYLLSKAYIIPFMPSQ